MGPEPHLKFFLHFIDNPVGFVVSFLQTGLSVVEGSGCMKKVDIEYKHIDMNNEKLERIINSALEEFSKNDYEKASTNNIVKNAGVSRGLLYHYFKNKEELFNFVIKHLVETTFDELEKDIDWSEQDFFERIRQSFIVKMKISKKYPYLLDFYFSNNNEKALNETKLQAAEYYKVFTDKFYKENVDFSKFKDDIDLDKTINTIVLTLKGMSRIILKDETDLEVLLKESDHYIAFFKKIFYK